jgi:hypothetical protein
METRVGAHAVAQAWRRRQRPGHRRRANWLAVQSPATGALSRGRNERRAAGVCPALGAEVLAEVTPPPTSPDATGNAAVMGESLEGVAPAGRLRLSAHLEPVIINERCPQTRDHHLRHPQQLPPVPRIMAWWRAALSTPRRSMPGLRPEVPGLRRAMPAARPHQGHGQSKTAICSVRHHRPTLDHRWSR